MAFLSIVFGFQYYASWVQQQWQSVQDQVENEAFVLEQSAKFPQWAKSIQAGFYKDALDIIQGDRAVDDAELSTSGIYIQETENSSCAGRKV
jgi:hypothetical protein